jgi:ElaB/YqjD/DUF883 family membrane-anchored ribosome-binding protein
MIAPSESRSPQKVALKNLSAEPTNNAQRNSATQLAKTVKQWVGEHPVAAVSVCATIGLLLGYIVKRR